MQDLRKGIFDVLIGVNLLREGLDLPEVSLVAILDADKEGFLRSETSIIQTIGRAARHINGHAILYADKETGSISRAIKKTEERRKIQLNFNKKNNIIPSGIIKPVSDVMEGSKNFTKKQFLSEMDKKIEEDYLTPKELAKQIDSLEKLMLEYANKLEFEEAAKLRDKITELKNRLFAA